MGHKKSLPLTGKEENFLELLSQKLKAVDYSKLKVKNERKTLARLRQQQRDCLARKKVNWEEMENTWITI
ncbi:MAG: hypothetical protein WCO58_01625 [bacterium]